MLDKHRRNKCKKTNEQWIKKEMCRDRKTAKHIGKMYAQSMEEIQKKQEREMFFSINSKEGTIIMLVYKI